jgi:hypothetical protein
MPLSEATSVTMAVGGWEMDVSHVRLAVSPARGSDARHHNLRRFLGSDGSER